MRGIVLRPSIRSLAPPMPFVKYQKPKMARFYPPMHFANRTISGNILSSPGTQTVRHCFTYLHQIDNILAVCLRRLYISYIFVWTSSSKPITAQRCVRGVLRFKQLFITLIKLFLYGLKYMALKCHYSS